MSEWLKSTLAAFGGGAVVLVGMMTIFKGLFIKFFESSIESSFEKNIEKFKNKLERSTRAYEILLEREMRFYENLDPITAELVPLMHDLRYFLKKRDRNTNKPDYEKIDECFKTYGELIIELKKEYLVHQTYIPQTIFNAYASVTKQMQEDLSWWFDMRDFLLAEEYEKINYEECDEKVEMVFAKLALAEMLVRSRLKHLSGEEE